MAVVVSQPFPPETPANPMLVASPSTADAESRRAAKLARWTDADRWPIPAWYQGSVMGEGTRSFEAFFTQQLRTRYLELEGDFRSVVGNFPPNDMSTAETVFSYLQVVRPALEAKRPDLLTVSSTLDLIERYMVWLYPDHLIETRVTSTLVKLETLRPTGWIRYAQSLRRAIDAPIDYARAPLDEAIAACNRLLLADLISSGLQIKRLRAFRNWGLLMVSLLLAWTPLLAEPGALRGWPVEALAGPAFRFNPWLNALTVVVVGMIGGFLSGFLQSRSSRVTLADYQETMLKLLLRPMVGGVVSLVLVVLMSWKLIPALAVENAGTFILAAFLAGFSERYFLRLLDLREGGDDESPRSDAKDAPPPTANASIVTDAAAPARR